MGKSERALQDEGRRRSGENENSNMGQRLSGRSRVRPWKVILWVILCATSGKVFSRPAIKSLAKGQSPTQSEIRVTGSSWDTLVMKSVSLYWMHIGDSKWILFRAARRARDRDFSRESIANPYKNARRQYLILKVYSYSARAPDNLEKKFRSRCRHYIL